MPLPFLQVPDFPNVPALPGVPPLARSALGVVAGPQLTRLTTDVEIIESLLGITASPRWGIFDKDGHKPLLAGDAVISVAPVSEKHIADYPIENGGFETYNKVSLPQEATVTIAKGGKLADRENFQAAATKLLDALDLCSVVGTDFVMKNMNVVGKRFERTAREGMQLIVLDVRLREVRLTAGPAFSNTKDAASAPTQDGGPVQAQAPTTAQAAVAGSVK